MVAQLLINITIYTSHTYLAISEDSKYNDYIIGIHTYVWFWRFFIDETQKHFYLCRIRMKLVLNFNNINTVARNVLRIGGLTHGVPSVPPAPPPRLLHWIILYFIDIGIPTKMFPSQQWRSKMIYFQRLRSSSYRNIIIH